MPGFSTSEVPENESRGPMAILPAGGYRTVINTCEVKRGKNNINTQYVEVEFGFLPYVPGGLNPIAKRKHWERFTFEHPNSEAVRIGRSMLADFIEALAGKSVTLTDIKQLEQLAPGKEVVLELYHQKRKDDGELQPRCGKFWSKSGHIRGKEKAPIPTASKAYSSNSTAARKAAFNPEDPFNEASTWLNQATAKHASTASYIDQQDDLPF